MAGVPGSVLWLLHGSAQTEANLLRQRAALDDARSLSETVARKQLPRAEDVLALLAFPGDQGASALPERTRAPLEVGRVLSAEAGDAA